MEATAARASWWILQSADGATAMTDQQGVFVFVFGTLIKNDMKQIFRKYYHTQNMKLRLLMTNASGLTFCSRLEDESDGASSGHMPSSPQPLAQYKHAICCHNRKTIENKNISISVTKFNKMVGYLKFHCLSFGLFDIICRTFLHAHYMVSIVDQYSTTRWQRYLQSLVNSGGLHKVITSEPCPQTVTTFSSRINGHSTTVLSYTKRVMLILTN